MTADAVTIALSLISHTNAGKTTLARTLLQRDVGEVRDAPHVTEFSEDHLLLTSDAGDELRLWDTPGLGDSVRLVRRLQRHGGAIGWFLTEVWDRWRDRSFWYTQQALRHVRDQAQVVLYLVNAAESPEAAAYVEAEMALLAWLDKPVLVLLNQLGRPRGADDDAREVERWRRHLQALRAGVQVLPMDAFARCWVQELALLHAVESMLAGDARDAMARLTGAWRSGRQARFAQAVTVLSASLARIACTRQRMDGAASSGGLGERIKRLVARVGPLFGGGGNDPIEPARAALAAQLDDDVRTSTGELLALHGIEGRAQGEILARVATQFDVQTRMSEGKAAVLGGMLSGALAGLKADIASGGLTMGGGLLAGGLLGALGGAGLARGINVMRGGGPPTVGWSAEALTPMVEAALLRYLAVAHFGRGRGQWVDGEAPAFWRDVVAAALAPLHDELRALWQSRTTQADGGADSERIAAALRPLLERAARDALTRLYPATAPAALS